MSGLPGREELLVVAADEPVVAYVTLAGGERLGVTPDHPVWNATTGAWTLIEECVVGDEVVDLTGRRLPTTSMWD